MRNLKKVLSLVLCVAVMLSVMVMGAGAVFSDQDKIENTEAVDACSALNIIGGYPDGSYKPEGNIKRSEICKMICVALNGGEEPTLGTPATPTFSDVRNTPNAAWAEKYIESCVSQGIVSGVGGGRFSPNGNVTGSQLAKMLLVCLGFDSDIEGYTGNAWDMNVNVRATQKGLYKGLEGLDVSAALTRDTAAQMVWNALQAGEVKYEYTWVGGDATKVTAVDKLDNANNPITLLKDKYNATIVDDGVLTSIDKDSKGTYNVVVTNKDTTTTYTKVEKDYSDLMGQKVDVMVKDGNQSKVYGIYANEDSKVIATGVVGDLDPVTGDSEKIKLDSTEYKIDTGAKVYHFNKTNNPVELIDLAKNHSGVQDAYSIKLIDNDGNGKIDRAVVTPFAVAEVTYVGTSSMTFQAVKGFDTIGNKDVDDVTAYDGIAEDDWVIVYAGSDTVDGNYNVEKATVVTGEVTGTRDSNKEGLINGTWYTSLVDGQTFTVGDKVDVVTVGEYAFNVEISDTTSTSADVLYLDDAEVNSEGLNKGLKAKLYFTDGTSKEAMISKISLKDAGTNKLVEYDVVTGDTTVSTELKVVKGDTAFGNDSSNPGKTIGTNKLVNALYTFTTDDGDYEIKVIANDNKAGYKGYATLGTTDAYNNKTLAYTHLNGTSNTGTMKIADNAVLFVEGKDGTKVLSGSTVNAWGDTKYTLTSGVALYSESNGFKYAQVGALVMNTEIPTASGDIAYGYVTAEPYLTKEGSTNYIQYTLWTADGEKVVREKVSSTTIEKGDFVSYNVGDGTIIKTVNKLDTFGSVTAYADGEDINVVKAADETTIHADFTNKLADDVTVIYVNTEETKGVDGGKIRTAAKDSNDKYIANVVYVLSSDNKEIDTLFVDVNNDLEKVDNPVVAEEKANAEAVEKDVAVLKNLFDTTTGQNDGSSASKPWLETTPVSAEGGNESIKLIASGVVASNGSTITVALENAGQSNIKSVEISSGALVGKGTNITTGTVIVKFTVTKGNASATTYAQFTTAANS